MSTATLLARNSHQLCALLVCEEAGFETHASLPSRSVVIVGSHGCFKEEGKETKEIDDTWTSGSALPGAVEDCLQWTADVVGYLIHSIVFWSKAGRIDLSSVHL